MQVVRLFVDMLSMDESLINFILNIIQNIYPEKLAGPGLAKGNNESRPFKTCKEALLNACDYDREKTRVWRAMVVYCSESQARSIVTEMEADLASFIERHGGIQVRLFALNCLPSTDGGRGRRCRQDRRSGNDHCEC